MKLECKVHTIETHNPLESISNIATELFVGLQSQEYSQLTSTIKYVKKILDKEDEKYPIPDDNNTYPISQFDLKTYINHLSDKITQVFWEQYSQVQLSVKEKECHSPDLFTKKCIHITPIEESIINKSQNKWALWKIKKAYHWINGTTKIKTSFLYA